MVEWKLSATGKVLPSAQASDSGINVNHLTRAINMSPRPFVLINEREISVLRRGLTKDGWKRMLFLQPADPSHDIYIGAGLLSTANKWLEKEIAIPNSGTDTDRFVCTCGARLETPDDLEVKQKYTCPKCSLEYSGQYYDGAIRHMQHTRLAGAALSLALVYSIEKDRTYSDKAAEILLSYANQYQLQAEADRLVQKSDCEAAWVIAMAQAYDLVYYSRSLSEQQRETIETQLFRPISGYFQTLGYEGVQGAWRLSATGVIGLSIKDAHLAAAALEFYGKWLVSEIDANGLYPVNLNEHFSAVSALVHLAEAFYRCGIDIFLAGAGSKSLKSMFFAPLNLMYPSFRLPAIGDAPFDSFLPLDLYEVAYRRWQDPEFSWVLKRGYKFSQSPVSDYQVNHPDKFCRSGFYAFLFGRDLPGRSTPPVFRSADYPSLGICSLRGDDGFMSTLDYHAHPNNSHSGRLGFTLAIGNDVVIPDFGTSSLYVDKIVEYSRSTAAHNTVVVDGRSQSLSGESRLAAQCYGTFVQGAEAFTNNCYTGVGHWRRIFLLDHICIVMDRLDSDNEHDYDWIMHCKGVPHMHCSGEHNKTEKSVRWNEACKVNDHSRIDWQLPDGKKLAFAMWLFGSGGEVTFDNSHDTSPVARFNQHGSKVSFLAAMVPVTNTDDVKIKKTGNVITLTKQDVTECILVPGCENEECRQPVLESDAEFAAIRICNGEIRSMVISHGSWLKWNGNSMMECSSKVGCLELVFEERGPQMKYRGEVSGMVKVRTNARALRVNGVRAQAYNTDGFATLRIIGKMVSDEMLPHKN